MTPMPPAPPGAPFATPIESLLLRVVIEQFFANTPSAPPAMLPPPVTRIDPPLLRTGPVTPVEMVCVDRVQAAHAAPGSPTVTSAASEARRTRRPWRWPNGYRAGSPRVER